MQTQQLLQTAEIQLAEIKEDREHSSFLLTVNKVVVMATQRGAINQLKHYIVSLCVDQVSPVATSAGRERELSPSMDMDNQDEATEGMNKVWPLFKENRKT